DEVVHGKGSLLGKMSGDAWQKFGCLRALLAWMWAHPGKKLLFMGGEFGQKAEWNHDTSLDWHVLRDPAHRGVQALASDLNNLYQNASALFEEDSQPHGFQWIQADAADANVLAFMRRSKTGHRHVVCVANLSPEPKLRYRVGFPQPVTYLEFLNTDATVYGG